MSPTTLTPTMLTPTPATFAASAAVLDAMADPVRLAIMWHCQGETNVTGLCAAVGRRQQCVSHHLTILKLRKLVSLRRQGKSNFYSLTDAGRDALARACR